MIKLKGMDKFRHELDIAKENYRHAREFENVIFYWNKRSELDYNDFNDEVVHLFGKAEKFVEADNILFSHVDISIFLDTYYKTIGRPHPKYRILVKMKLFLLNLAILANQDRKRYLSIVTSFYDTID